MIHDIRGSCYISDLESVRTDDTSDFGVVIGVCQDSAEDNVSCEYHHYNLADGTIEHNSFNPGEWSYELFEAAVDEVITARIKRETVLVHCHAGASRSVGVWIAAIATLDEIGYDEAREIVVSTTHSQPSSEIIDAAKRYIEEHQ